MKVLMINGSRREKGCTYTALCQAAEVLNEAGIETEILHVGLRAVNGEMDQLVQEAVQKVKTADALIVGSPVYYAGPSGEVIAFLDRLWGAAGDDLCFKPAAAISSARRAGTTTTLDVLNKYFAFSQMPVVSSCYWNMVHGSKPEDVLKDEEGVQIVRTLARNMVWLLQSIEAGKAAGIRQPEPFEKKRTNFIR